jgi:hypothetical protein
MAVQHSYGKMVTDGLVLYLNAADANSYVSGSTTWYDLAGSNNGTLLNGVAYTGSNFGSLVFNGVDVDAKVLFSSYNFPTTYTKFIFFSTNDFVSRNLLSSITPVDHALYLTAGTISAGHNASYRRVQTPISTNQWYSTAVTYDNNTNEMKLYLDGVLKSTSTAGTLLPGGTYKIGEHSSNQSFNGRIPVVLLYNKVLTQEEIFQNHNATKTRFGLT